MVSREGERSRKQGIITSRERKANYGNTTVGNLKWLEPLENSAFHGIITS